MGIFQTSPDSTPCKAGEAGVHAVRQRWAWKAKLNLSPKLSLVTVRRGNTCVRMCPYGYHKGLKWVHSSLLPSPYTVHPLGNLPACRQAKSLGPHHVSVECVKAAPSLCLTKHKSLKIKTDSKGEEWISVIFISNSNAFCRLRCMALPLLLYISGPTFMFHFPHPR